MKGNNSQTSISMSPYLDVAETAHYLKLKVATIYAMVHQRRLRYRKHGSRLIFSKEDLDQFSNANIIEPQWSFLNQSAINAEGRTVLSASSLTSEDQKRCKRKPNLQIGG